MAENQEKAGSSLGYAFYDWLRRHPIPFIVIFLVIGSFYGLLWLLTHRIQDEAVSFIRESLKCDLRARRIAVTPGLRIELEDVRITSPASTLKLPDLTVDNVLLAADVPSLIAGKVKLREVVLDNPTLTIYEEPDGSYNISYWLDRAAACEVSDSIDSFPARIAVNKGRVLMEPPPGVAWTEALELAAADGVMGLTPDLEIGAELDLASFGSRVSLKGTLAPCVEDGFHFKGQSENFDFTTLGDIVKDMFFRRRREELEFPGGVGRLSFVVEGSYDQPIVSGDVSTRDADAKFSLVGRTMSITDIRAGAGTERLTGSGKVDFSDEAIPYNFSFVLTDLSMQRLFRGALGFKYAPEGMISGYAKVSGNLTGGRPEVDSGNITIEHVKLKAPAPALGGAGRIKGAIVEIPVESIKARLRTQKDRLRLSGIQIKAERWTASGWAEVGGWLPAGGFSSSNDYSMGLSIHAADASYLASYFPSLRNNISGMLDSEIKLYGSFGDAGITGGEGSIKIRSGYVTNPYGGGRVNYSHQTLDFDIAEVNLEFSRHNLRVAGAEVSGNGFDVTANGSVGYDGKLQIVARGRLAPERAREFAGLEQYIPDSDTSSMSSYDARCDITGSIREPRATWHRPKVTRWQNYLW